MGTAVSIAPFRCAVLGDAGRLIRRFGAKPAVQSGQAPNRQKDGGTAQAPNRQEMRCSLDGQGLPHYESGGAVVSSRCWCRH
ncbi:MAG: hypothetical protein RBU37_21965 [Myxococcota bacterium]|nr:hypothetical protein [Myxococcota bacterium]